MKWFRKAADQGLTNAQMYLGLCYATGQGVAKDDAEAAKWVRKAAEQNNACAQNQLGVCYAKGQGVPKDEVEAVKWYRKAAEQNLAIAQDNVGHFYAIGQGVAKNEAEAVKWFRKAAEQHLASAQYNLGHCYATGRHVSKDEVEGYKWWLLAAGRGDQGAKKAIPLIEGKMTPQQIATGQKLARASMQQEMTSAGSNTSPAVEQMPVSQTTKGIEERPTPASNSIRYRVVNVAQGDFLNVRAGPGSDSPVFETLAPTETGIELGPGRVANGPTVWQEVTLLGLGKSGWVNADYLTAERPQTSLAASASQPRKQHLICRHPTIHRIVSLASARSARVFFR